MGRLVCHGLDRPHLGILLSEVIYLDSTPPFDSLNSVSEHTREKAYPQIRPRWIFVTKLT